MSYEDGWCDEHGCEVETCGAVGDGTHFRYPGTNSALRAGRQSYDCPTCGAEDVLTAEDKARGYQCDACADAVEFGIW